MAFIIDYTDTGGGSAQAIMDALPDSGAEWSIMDSHFAHSLSIKSQSTANTIRLSQVAKGDGKGSQATLSEPVKITAVFPQSDRAPISFSHCFVLVEMDRKSIENDGPFLIGSELLPKLFPDGLPHEYFCRNAGLSASDSFSSAATTVSARAASASINSARSLREDEMSFSGAGSSQMIDGLAHLSQQINDFGAGDTPMNERPERVQAGDTDLSENSAEFIENHAKLMKILESALETNQRITGFCNVSDSKLHLDIDLSKLSKRYRQQYPVAKALVPLVSMVIQRWLDSGRIKPAPKNCPFNNPLVVAPKKDEDGLLTGIRVCLDVRALNVALLTQDAHEIPHIMAMFERLAGSVLFGEFDLAEAYLQFELDEESQILTAFTWNGQQYVFVGCPFGLSVLPSHFQRIMARIFADLMFTYPYLDNLPFGSPDWDSHASHALAILERLNAVNLKVKLSSVKVGRSSLRCLGFFINRHGVGLDPVKLDKLGPWELPRTGKQMASFLGFVGFLRQHIRHFADLAAPLEAVKQQEVIEPTDSLRDAFEQLKKAILSAPILKFPNHTKSFRIATDASNVGVGGVLYQPSFPGEPMTAKNIVQICSKALSKHQRRYAAYKKELWGVVYCLRKFHPLIWGRRDLVLETDHKPLTFMFLTPKLSITMQQWFDVIMDYSFTIIHRPGIMNVLPDALSRLYAAAYEGSEWGVFAGSLPRVAFDRKLITESDETQFSIDDSLRAADPEKAAEVEKRHREMLRQMVTRRVRATIMARTTKMDATDSSAAVADGFGTIPMATGAKPIVQFMTDDEFRLAIELERRGAITPNSEVHARELIQKAHALGHYGRRAVFDALYDSGFWWRGMRAQIEEELRFCDACLRYTVGKHGYHPSGTVHALLPGDHYQVDLSVHLPESPDGFKCLMVLIDVFTNFVVMRALKDEHAETIARELWEIFALIGLPRILQSDRGPQFVSDVVAALNRLIGVEQRFISTFNPRTDGKVERSIGTVTTVIKKLLHGTDKYWPLFVSFAQFTFNMKISAATGAAPFTLRFGTKANEIRDYTNDSDNPQPISLDEWKAHQERIISVIYPATHERVKQLSEKMKKMLNKHRRVLLASIPIGAVVMLKDPKRADKREPKYIGPYSVVRRAQSGAYILRDATGDLLDRFVPVDQMKIVSKKPMPVHPQGDIYTVRKILDHRGSPGNYQYLIDWKGYSEQTWEPEANILDYDTVKQYWERRNAPNNATAATDASSQRGGVRPVAKKRSNNAAQPASAESGEQRATAVGVRDDNGRRRLRQRR